MKKAALYLITILATIHGSKAASYYVSTEGSNVANDGSESAPFRTIQHAANQMLDGDTCFIMAGIYREAVTVKTDNGTFKNYGDGQVIVSGADLVSAWVASSQGPGIYEAPFTRGETDFTQFFVKNELKQMARWPNNLTENMMNPEDTQSGYASCQVFGSSPAGQTQKTVSFTGLAAEAYPTDYFQGGYFRGITGKTWWNPMGKITGSNGSDLAVNAITSGWIDNNNSVLNNSGKGYGFIFHLNALDQEGEWYHEGNTIYFKPPSGLDPNDMELSAKKRKWAFDFNGKDQVVLEGINIHAASIDMRNSNDSKIWSCSIQYLWPFFTRAGYAVANPNTMGGIWIQGDRNEIKDSYIAHSWGTGVYIDNNSQDNKIENCLIEDIGWIAQFTSSIQNFGKGTIITHSTLGSTGRFHIRTNDQVFITYNDLYDCMKMGQDAGSIQCTNGGVANYGVALNMNGSEIAYNRIHDSNTLTNGVKEFVVALYLEGCYNYTVHHNLIYNLKTDVVPDGTFTYLGPRYAQIEDCYYYNNTVWNLDWGIRIWNRGTYPATGATADIRNTRFWNNIIDSGAPDKGNNAAPLFAKIDFSNNLRNQTQSTSSSLFEDAASGDFSLKPEAVMAIDQGIDIPGITDGHGGASPDIGAVELGSPFPMVGATISREDFNLGPTLSIQDFHGSSSTNLNVYPIPLQDELHLLSTSNIISEITIYTIDGELVFKASPNKMEERIYLGKLPPGVYIARIWRESQLEIMKLMKR